MREISIADALAVAAMPTHLRESSSTKFLRAVIESAGEDDPLYMTVEDRMMCVAHYLAATLSSTGEDEANFSIGDQHFLDYFQPEEIARNETAELGELLGSHWQVVQLSGQMAEAIERLGGGNFSGDAAWVAGRMAFQLKMKDEQHPADGEMPDTDMERWYFERLSYLSSLPESDFFALMIAWESSRSALTHLFNISSDDAGLVVLPKGGAGMSPARFPVRACLGEWTKNYAGKAK